MRALLVVTAILLGLGCSSLASPEDVGDGAGGVEEEAPESAYGAEAPPSIVNGAADAGTGGRASPLPDGDAGTMAVDAGPDEARPRRVGLFAGPGAGAEYVDAVRAAVASDANLRLGTFTDGSVDFARYDVVVFPGGAGTTQWNALGAAGQRKLRAFVAGGGGYIGVCAGFYMGLAAQGGLLAASHYEPWARGEGTVEVEIGEGAAFGAPGRHRLRYVNGPIVYPTSGVGANYTVLATFRGNIGGANAVSMVGKPAVVAASYERGRVVAFSPHPELSGLGSLLRDAIVWASARP